jgi:hypothetical protein
MYAFAILTILAIFLAPLFAIQVSVVLAKRKERKERQLAVFKALMSTRGARLAPRHVEALNLVDVEFYGKDKKSKEVLDAWKIYLDHMSDTSLPPELWVSKQLDYLVELLYKMAIYLGYEFDKVYIKKPSYYPRGYGEAEVELTELRKKLIQLLSEDSILALKVKMMP